MEPVVKRSPLKRGKPLKRGGPIKRRTRLRSVNPERKAKARVRDFGKLAEYAAKLPCCCCRAAAPSDPAHVRSRGAGGHAWTDAGHGNIIPLCRTCHDLQHAQGWTALWAGGREAAELLARSVGEGFRTTEDTCKTL